MDERGVPVPDPVLPDYGGACIAGVGAAIRGRGGESPVWLPASVAAARQVVLLVIDGLGWDQLRARAAIAPVLAGMEGGPVTSVSPTTTATALTSITTGLPPAAHEVMGYRVRVGQRSVLNVLRWRTADGDAEAVVTPAGFQTHAAFGGTAPVVVTRSEFARTGFTHAHLPGVRLDGWRVASAIPVLVRRHLLAGEPFVYAYYDGVDKVAHERGFGPFYDAELRAADRLVGDIVDALPPGAALAVTADHGQVLVGPTVRPLPPSIVARTELVSGEGRFRWLHARSGEAGAIISEATAAFGDVAWVRTVDELEAEGWFGGTLTAAGRARLGDVAIICHADVAVADATDPGESSLQCRHGSATRAEMLVPLLGAGA